MFYHLFPLQPKTIASPILVSTVVVVLTKAVHIFVSVVLVLEERSAIKVRHDSVVSHFCKSQNSLWMHIQVLLAELH